MMLMMIAFKMLQMKLVFGQCKEDTPKILPGFDYSKVCYCRGYV